MATNVLGRVNTLHSSHVVVLDRNIVKDRKYPKIGAEMVLTFDKNRNR